MNLKRSALIVVGICIVAAIVLAGLYCSDNPPGNGANKNAFVASIDDFDVQDVDVGSHTSGSVIVQKFQDSLVLRVIGDVTVGEDDFGGVCFYFEEDFELESITSSYRDELDAGSVMLERVPGDTQFAGGTSVSFGRLPMGPGDGVFEIVYEYSGEQSIEDIETISIGVAVGSYYVGGYPAVGHVYKTIEVRL